MDSFIVSIIIPVYNVEKYLSNCIDSILNQTFDNIECILINDGSIDSSGAICDSYAKKDNRIKVVHQENEGVSIARNRGLEEATGDWIMFVDSDDWIERDTIMKSLKFAHTHNADIVGFGINSSNNQVQELISPDIIIRDTSYIKYYIIDAMVPNYDWMLNKTIISIANIRSSCAKLYSKEISKSLKFHEGLAIGEDMLFCISAYSKSSKVVFFNDRLYHYVENTDSAMYKFRPNIHKTNNIIYQRLEKLHFDNFSEIERNLFNLGIIYECLYNELYFNVNHHKSNYSFKQKFGYLKKITKEKIYSNCSLYYQKDVIHFLPLHQRIFLYLVKEKKITLIILLHKFINLIKKFK